MSCDALGPFLHIIFKYRSEINFAIKNLIGLNELRSFLKSKFTILIVWNMYQSKC